MLSSFLAERFGRKPCLIVGALTQIVSAAAIYFCESYTSLMVTLCLNGLCVITVMVPSYSLLSEICLIRYRSPLASLNTLHGNAGWLIGLVVGLVIPIKVYSLALSFPSLVFMLVCWKMPESPVWLMRRDREAEARATLQCLRGEAYNIEPEVKELEAVISGEQMTSDKTVMELIKERSFIIPQLLTCVVCFFQVVSQTSDLLLFSSLGDLWLRCDFLLQRSHFQ